MALFNKGDKVIRVSSMDNGIIVAVGPCGRGGRQLYRVNFNGVETDELEGNLMADCNIDDPFERLRNNMFGSFVEFSKMNTTFKIRNSNISTVSSLKASRTLFRAYQFKPLLKFLNSDNKRILVADEVGLGKTIEAGHIMLEMKARNDFRNALVICPISLQSKWKAELHDKFGLTFTIVESKSELRQMLLDRDGSARAIINYEKIRSEGKDDNGIDKNELLRFLSETGKRFSFVLCDEAHKLRNETTQTYHGAELLLESADSVAFLTATPIMISERNLYNLLHLLDGQRYSKYALFEQGLRENAPFIRALSELAVSDSSLPDIARRLVDTEIVIQQEINDNVYSEIHRVGDHFKDFPLFNRIIDRMENEPDSLTLRAQLQYDIMSMSQMNQVFSRTRKREVTTDWSQAERHPYPCIVGLYKEEQEEFDKVIENYVDDNSYTDDWGERHLTPGGALGLVQKKRQVASSVYAFLNDEKSLEAGFDEYGDMPDAKFDELLKVISAVFASGTRKIIVFALFRKTLMYLAIRLKKAGFGSAVIHGGVKDRQSELDKFQNDTRVQVLLSSEVGSEGLDMQFCNSMVNYDLPWNPMVVEQRIGRIDRFGQQSPIVHIYNMIVKGSIQEDIYERLLDRIGIFRSSIGDMEAILDAEVERHGRDRKISLQELYSRMEKELFCTKLSREERKRKIEEIAQAFMNEKENIKKIEEGLTNSLTNDAYFRSEINRILNNSAYVTERELKVYLELLIKECLTTCRLEDCGEGIYSFDLPKSTPKVLSNFLARYQPAGEENYSMFQQFKNRIAEKDSFLLTFDQEVAYKRRDLIFVNLYNPIIQAALVYFSSKSGKESRTFSFDVKQESLDLQIEKGRYFLAVYQVETSKYIFGVKKITNTLRPLLYDIRKCSVVDDVELADAFFGRTQVKGEYQRSENFQEVDPAVVTELQLDLAEAIEKYRTEYYNELRLQADNTAIMLRQQLEAYYKYRVDNMNLTIEKDVEKLSSNNDKDRRNAEGALRLHKANLAKLESEREDELARVTRDHQLAVRTQLLSINYVNVI